MRLSPGPTSWATLLCAPAARAFSQAHSYSRFCPLFLPPSPLEADTSLHPQGSLGRCHLRKTFPDTLWPGPRPSQLSIPGGSLSAPYTCLVLTRERQPRYKLKTEPSASADPRRRSRSLRSSIATGLFSSEAPSQGGVSLCPARHHTSVWRGPGRLRGWGAAPLTSGNRRTLQYFTPFRSLGGDSPREMVSDPVWRPRGQVSTPPTLGTSVRSGSNSGGNSWEVCGT